MFHVYFKVLGMLTAREKISGTIWNMKNQTCLKLVETGTLHVIRTTNIKRMWDFSKISVSLITDCPSHGQEFYQMVKIYT